MKYIWQLCVILAVSFAGELLNEWLSLPIPASVWGLGIMLILLVTKVIPVEKVKQTSTFLINIMSIMFVPAAVGLMVAWERLKGMLIPFVLIIMVNTVIVMVAAGKITDFILRKERHNE
ncbi:MAG: CidA/LrgA family protein [Lachnospiraceae bacterium]